MSLAGVNPDETENFEDVRPGTELRSERELTLYRSRSSLPSKVRNLTSQDPLPASGRLTDSPRIVVQQMSTYWGILEKVRGSQLRLTKMDDEILESFKKEFPEFDPAATIDEDEMKSKAGKERWRDFINQYEKKIDDFNFGTMLRANPKWEYGEKETIFGQSYLVESSPAWSADRLRLQLCGCSSTPSRSHGEWNDCAVPMVDFKAHSLLQESRRSERLDIREEPS